MADDRGAAPALELVVAAMPLLDCAVTVTLNVPDGVAGLVGGP